MPTVSVVITVKEDRAGAAAVLDSLLLQTRPPDEIIVVDGGSTDGTLDMLHARAGRGEPVQVVSAPGANIATGRDIGTRSAKGDVIATTDAGCRAAPDWLERLIAPFEADPGVEFVAGFYTIEARTRFEQVVGLATMRGQLVPVCEQTFNPSGRSMAYRRDVWARAGGWPQWLDYSEDTLFDHKMRAMNVNWRFAADALVSWRPRSTLRALARQFYCYGTGRGQTQLGAEDFAYNLRNIAIVVVLACMCMFTVWALPFLTCALAYFHVWTFHHKALSICRRMGRLTAYPMTLCVMWVVLYANLAGYLVGTWRRWRSRGRVQQSMAAYLATP